MTNAPSAASLINVLKNGCNVRRKRKDQNFYDASMSILSSHLMPLKALPSDDIRSVENGFIEISEDFRSIEVISRFCASKRSDQGAEHARPATNLLRLYELTAREVCCVSDKVTDKVLCGESTPSFAFHCLLGQHANEMQ